MSDSEVYFVLYTVVTGDWYCVCLGMMLHQPDFHSQLTGSQCKMWTPRQLLGVLAFNFNINHCVNADFNCAETRSWFRHTHTHIATDDLIYC